MPKNTDLKWFLFPTKRKLFTSYLLTHLHYNKVQPRPVEKAVLTVCFACLKGPDPKSSENTYMQNYELATKDNLSRQNFDSDIKADIWRQRTVVWHILTAI